MVCEKVAVVLPLARVEVELAGSKVIFALFLYFVLKVSHEWTGKFSLCHGK